MVKKGVLLFMAIIASQLMGYAQSMHLIKAKILYDLENYKDLYDEAYKALLADPKSDMANFYMGVSYCYTGDTANAQYFLNESILLATETNKLDFMDIRAAYLFDIGKYHESLADLLFLLQNERRQFGVYFYAALCYENLEKMDSAGMYYRAALQISANSEEVLLEYARYKMVIGDMDSSATLYRNGLANNRRSIPAMMGLARIDLINENFSGLINITDDVVKEIKNSYYDSTSALIAYIDVYHFRMLASIYFEKYEMLNADLKSFETKEPYTMGLKTLLNATALIIQDKLPETRKEISKINDSIAFAYNEMNQVHLVMLMHDKDIKAFTSFLIKWQDKALPGDQSLKERIFTVPPMLPLQKKTIAGDIIYYKNSEKGELTLGLTILPDKDFVFKVMEGLSKLNQTKKSTPSSIKAEAMVKELYDAI